MKLLAVAVLAAGVTLTGCTPSTPATPVSNPAVVSAQAPTPPPTPALELTCEPDADARLVGDVIVNKDCPELNAAKEQAQQAVPAPPETSDIPYGDQHWVDFTWCLDAASQSDGATTAQEYDDCLAAYKAAASR